MFCGWTSFLSKIGTNLVREYQAGKVFMMGPPSQLHDASSHFCSFVSFLERERERERKRKREREGGQRIS
jgi:hypothetical protein